MNRVSSVFSQMLKPVPATLFDRAVCKYRGERKARGFRSWDPFVAMLSCQLGQTRSLREIEEGMRASEGKLRQLGELCNLVLKFKRPDRKADCAKRSITCPHDSDQQPECHR